MRGATASPVCSVVVGVRERCPPLFLSHLLLARELILLPGSAFGKASPALCLGSIAERTLLTRAQVSPHLPYEGMNRKEIAPHSHPSFPEAGGRAIPIICRMAAWEGERSLPPFFPPPPPSDGIADPEVIRAGDLPCPSSAVALGEWPLYCNYATQ